MKNRDKLICAGYALVSLIAVPATWINNIAFMNQPDHQAIALTEFIQDAYVNPAAASLSNDLLLLATGASIFMILEGRRLGIRLYWLYLALSPLTAISITFPLFLMARHIKLTKEQDDLAAQN